MQKVFFIFLLVSFWVFIFISCSNIDSSKYLDNWVGNYYYEEEPVKANADYNMTMTWTLSINRNTDSVQGVLVIDGQQTHIKLTTDISGDTNTIAIIYNQHIEGLVERHKKGDTLFILSKSTGKLKTKWLTFEPRLLENQPKVCNCFIQGKE